MKYEHSIDIDASAATVWAISGRRPRVGRRGPRRYPPPNGSATVDWLSVTRRG